MFYLLFLGLAVHADETSSFDPGGCALLQVKPLKERVLKPKDVAITVWPSGLLDENQTQYLTQGTPTIAILTVANPMRRHFSRGWVIAEIPEGVVLVGVNQYLPWHLRKTEKTERDGKPYLRLTIPCGVHPTTIPRGQQRGTWYGLHRPPALWLRTELPEGSRPGKLYVRFRYEEKFETEVPSDLKPEESENEDDEADDEFEEREEEPKPPPETAESSVHLAVLGPLEARQPKLARSGVMGRFILNWNSTQPGLPDILGNTIRQLGYNYVVTFPRWPGGRPDLQLWVETQISNGFEVSIGEEFPRDLRFIVSGEPDSRAVTPAALYDRDPEIEEKLLGRLRKIVSEKRVSSLCSNWEPYRLLKTGCESGRSRDEFIKWSKLPADEVKAQWPAGIRKMHPKRYREFLNWQLGRVTKMMAQMTADAGRAAGIDSRVTFWMSNDAIWNPPDNLLKSPICTQAWGDLPCNLLTWSYYYVPRAEQSKPETDRFGAPQVVRCSALARHLDRLFGRDRKIRLGCLYGFDQVGGHGYYLPEQVAFLHLSTIFAGMSIAQNYAEWPIWDGRYAQEIARSNTRIARWEELILKGEKSRQHIVVPASPYPQTIPEAVKPSDQELKGGWAQPGYLFSFEYQLDDRRLITVANTWDNGDCFFRLRIFGLDEDVRHVLLEPDEARRFGSETEGTFTGPELAEGVLVHVGAMRWAALLIEPHYQKKRYHRAITPAEVAAAMKRRRPELDRLLRERGSGALRGAEEKRGSVPLQ